MDYYNQKHQRNHYLDRKGLAKSLAVDEPLLCYGIYYHHVDMLMIGTEIQPFGFVCVGSCTISGIWCFKLNVLQCADWNYNDHNDGVTIQAILQYTINCDAISIKISITEEYTQKMI